MKRNLNLEEKKELLNKLYKRCCLVIDFFIEIDKRKGRNWSSTLEKKQYIIERYESIKDDNLNVNNYIRGFREAIQDENENIRNNLSKEEQKELKQLLNKKL